MSNAAKLKKRALELEQKKQLDKALALYIQFLQESDGAIDDIDVPLYNRVGDLLLRTGNSSDALNYYEKAVDLYAERGFLNNAIALCNKVLRQSPGRASIYYKLGKISATKGFKSDAKKNFLEYADRMQKAGQIDEAFRALKEFADLCPDQDDIRLMLAEQLSKENRQGEALEQLQKLHDKLDSEGRTAEVRATVDRMKSIDPDAVPRMSGSYRPQKSQDLIFLDTTFEKASRARQADVPAPPPAGRQVSDPDLVVLTLADQPDIPVSPLHNAAIADAFSLDIDAPAGESVALPLLDVEDTIDLGPDVADDAFALPAAAEITGETPVIADAFDTATLDSALLDAAMLEVSPPEASAFDSSTVDLSVLDTPVIDTPVLETSYLSLDPDPAAVDLTFDEPSSYVSGPPLGVDYAGDLSADVTLPSDSGELFDFRAPPRSDADDAVAVPLSTLDPDVAFPSFDLDDTTLPSADDITSGASLAAALAPEETLGIDALLDVSGNAAALADDEDAMLLEPSLLDAGPSEAAPSSVDLEWSMPVAAGDAPQPAADFDRLDVVDDRSPGPADADASRRSGRADTPAAIDVAAESETVQDVSLDAGADADVEAVADASPSDDEPTRSPNDVDGALGSVVVADVRPGASRETAAVVAPAPEPPRQAGWEAQRDHAEQLLEAGDRAGGVRELEDVAAQLERLGDLERAVSIIDELIRLLPDSVRHHQKRVELAFRSNDRVKLIDAYLELGDALFRSGEERKARAVYQRVFELAPDDPRARAAVDSVASISLRTASGSIPAIPSTPPSTPEVRQAGAPPRVPDTHVPYQPGPGNGARPSAGISVPPPARKPSPLDRAAAGSDFVDLGEWLRSGESPKSTRMVAEEKPPTGDEQADFQEMLKRFKQGVAENVDEEDYESHYDLGVAYKEMGLIDEAVAEFQKALRGTAHRVRTYEALGQCFVEKEQYQVAASVLSRAIAIGEGDDHHLVGVLYLLGLATEALNKPGDALDYYQRVFAVDIEFRDVAERISAIERKAT